MISIYDVSGLSVNTYSCPDSLTIVASNNGIEYFSIVDTINFSIYIDDTNASISPSSQEIFNNDIDEDCNGEVEQDLDGDGYSSLVDCDDTNSEVSDRIKFSSENHCRIKR